jgi:predicted N-formylglutamate amidohydrolase
MPAPLVLVTCEHGGNRIPKRYAGLFAGATEALHSHRGYDPGALALARDYSRQLRAPLVYSTTSRLLVELNRSVSHPSLFSEFTRGLDSPTRQSILAAYYLPYREKVERLIQESVRKGRPAVHLSVHTFSPVIGDVERNADVGLLYDPARTQERWLCAAWKNSLSEFHESVRVRLNYPYRGKDDGLTTHLRRTFPRELYLGLELEVNQAWPRGDGGNWRRLRTNLVNAFATAVT